MGAHPSAATASAWQRSQSLLVGQRQPLGTPVPAAQAAGQVQAFSGSGPAMQVLARGGQELQERDLIAAGNGVATRRRRTYPEPDMVTGALSAHSLRAQSHSRRGPAPAGSCRFPAARCPALGLRHDAAMPDLKTGHPWAQQGRQGCQCKLKRALGSSSGLLAARGGHGKCRERMRAAESGERARAAHAAVLRMAWRRRASRNSGYLRKQHICMDLQAPRDMLAAQHTRLIKAAIWWAWRLGAQSSRR